MSQGLNYAIADLKPENIVFSQFTSSTASEILVKIIDFGVGIYCGTGRELRYCG
jgi:serine/threonine protein kinase